MLFQGDRKGTVFASRTLFQGDRKETQEQNANPQLYVVATRSEKSEGLVDCLWLHAEQFNKRGEVIKGRAIRRRNVESISLLRRQPLGTCFVWALGLLATANRFWGVSGPTQCYPSSPLKVVVARGLCFLTADFEEDSRNQNMWS